MRVAGLCHVKSNLSPQRYCDSMSSIQNMAALSRLTCAIFCSATSAPIQVKRLFLQRSTQVNHTL